MLQLKQETNQIAEGSAFLISGSAAVFVPEYIRWTGAVKVSRALAEHPNTMLQFTPVQLILIKAGAEEISSKFSSAIRTVEGEAAFMKIYDITKVI